MRPPYRKDITGRVYGRLTVIEYIGKRKTKRLWLCVCECGKSCETTSDCLRTGGTSSCGCLRRETAAQTVSKYRKDSIAKDKKLYFCWASMIKRCADSSSHNFSNYGGRGISVCERWQDFSNFQDDMYESYAAHLEIHGSRDTSIERKDVNGNYELDNCCWATRKEQARNRQNSIYYELDGERLHIREWAERLGIQPSAVTYRITKHGWSLRDALTKTTTKHGWRKSNELSKPTMA